MLHVTVRDYKLKQNILKSQGMERGVAAKLRRQHKSLMQFHL